MNQLIELKLDQIKSSKSNPRKRFDDEKMNDLIASVRQKGIIQPLVVRPLNGHYEIVCGTRRFKAAEAVGLANIPAIVRDLDDKETLELQIIENLQREDVHPMEEADGYFQLSHKPGYDVEKIAGKIGRSVKYVYDRMKLLSLSKEAQQLFLADKFTAGHAILLARLSPSAQADALNPANRAVFEIEYVTDDLYLTEIERKGGRETLKCRSVREFQCWIDAHVRFDREKVDTMLFPETVEDIKLAKETAEKIVPITENHFVQTSARSDERTFGPQAWKRADGKAESKTCEHSVTGVFVVGPGRGQSMKVCTAKEKCKVHWGTWQKERAQRQKLNTSGLSEKEKAKQEAEQSARMEEERKDNELRLRWKKAKPAIYKAIGDRVKVMPAAASGILAKIILAATRVSSEIKDDQVLPLGKSAEDLVRHVAHYILCYEAASEWRSSNEFPKMAKKIGLDVLKVVDEAAPPVEAKDGKPAPGKAKSNKGKSQ